MFAPSVTRVLLVPAVLLAMAGGFALAQGSDEEPQPDSVPALTAPATSSPEGVLPGGAAPNPTLPNQVAPAPETTTPEAVPVEKEKKRRAKKVVPVLDPVGEGKMLFETRCGLCHSVPRPSAHTMTEWPECINRMAARSYLRESDTKLMMQYLEHELKPQSSSEWDEKAS